MIRVCSFTASRGATAMDFAHRDRMMERPAYQKAKAAFAAA